jgi:hypothetical protein
MGEGPFVGGPKWLWVKKAVFVALLRLMRVPGERGLENYI